MVCAASSVDHVAFHRLQIPLVVGPADSQIAVANCPNLNRSDFSNIHVATCAEAGSVCLSQHCDDGGESEFGFSCLCDSGGAQRDATDCALVYAQMEVYVPKLHELEFLVQKPFSKTVEVVLWNPSSVAALDWEMGVQGANATFFNASSKGGTIDPQNVERISVTVSSADLQARPAPHRFTYKYTASSTCSCDDQRAITMNGTAYVSASLSANDSYVSLDSPAATIEAGSAMTFSVTPMDAYGKEILQDADLSFSTELSHYDIPVRQSELVAK